MNAKSEVCDCGKSHHPLGIKGELPGDCTSMSYGALGQFLSTLQAAVWLVRSACLGAVTLGDSLFIVLLRAALPSQTEEWHARGLALTQVVCFVHGNMTKPSS